MFFLTKKRLIPVIYKILTNPFDFVAVETIHKLEQGEILENAPDPKALISVCQQYNETKHSFLMELSRLRHKLNTHYRFPLDSDNISATDLRQLYRIYTILELKDCGQCPPLLERHMRLFTKWLSYNEKIALIISGNLSAITIDGEIQIAPTDKRQQNVWRRYTQAQERYQHQLATDIKHISRQHLSIQHIEEASRTLLRRVCYLDHSYLISSSFDLRSVQALLLLLKLYAAYFINKQHPLSAETLQALKLDTRLLQELLPLHKQQLISYQFLEFKGRKLSLSTHLWHHKVTHFFKALSEAFSEQELIKQYFGGLFFEKHYTLPYLKNTFPHRLQVSSGFDRYQVGLDTNTNTDVDIIVFDRQEQHYYFLQIKYILSGSAPFYHQMLKNMRAHLHKGIEQLEAAKSLIKEHRLDKLLHKKGFDHPVTKSSFILIHNIPEYNGQVTESGIELYDWHHFIEGFD